MPVVEKKQYMIKVYAMLIKAGTKTIDDIPETYRADVTAELNNQES